MRVLIFKKLVQKSQLFLKPFFSIFLTLEANLAHLTSVHHAVIFLPVEPLMNRCGSRLYLKGYFPTLLLEGEPCCGCELFY